jgi:hypothetical protein
MEAAIEGLRAVGVDPLGRKLRSECGEFSLLGTRASGCRGETIRDEAPRRAVPPRLSRVLAFRCPWRSSCGQARMNT